MIACDGRDDAAEFAEIRGAMKVLEMTDQDIWEGEWEVGSRKVAKPV